MPASLPEKDVANEGTDDLVDAPQVRAHDEHGDDHDDGALDRLRAVRPVDLAELRDRLLDEAAAAALVLDGHDRGAAGRGRLGYAAARLARLIAGGAARVAPLPAGLVRHG